MPPVVVADPGSISTIGLALPADIVGRLADVLAADDDVSVLRTLVSLVAVQRDGLLVCFDL